MTLNPSQLNLKTWFLNTCKKQYLATICGATTFFLLLFSRRWQQLLNPQVWDEDGTPVPSLPGKATYLGGSNLSDYINHGWHSFFSPVNGYLILVPKIISRISLLTGLINYPIVSTSLSWLFIVLVCLAVYLSPTYLRGRCFCALSILLIPSDPEVFGIPLYTLWWAALLLFLLALWDERREHKCLRIMYLLLGGFSSPLILLVLPLLYLRAFLLKHLKFELIIAIAATAIAGIQLFCILKSGSGKPPKISGLTHVILTFFGNFFVGNVDKFHKYIFIGGLVFFLLLLLYAYKLRTKVVSYFLIYLLLGVILLQMSRIVTGINQHTAGPRYFFYPFILMFWIMIQSFYLYKNKIYKFAIFTLCCIPILNATPAWSRTHDDLMWESHLSTCSLLPDNVDYEIPVEWDGNKATVWYLNLKAISCRKFLGQRWSFNKQIKIKTFPYVLQELSPGAKPPADGKLLASTMTGTDFPHSKFDGLKVIGSYTTSDSDVGSVTLQFSRGERLLYRSGPGKKGQSITILGYENQFATTLPTSEKWIILEFINPNLPPVFSVSIKDDGVGWGEWSAIAIKE
jgi:hypothetical protein